MGERRAPGAPFALFSVSLFAFSVTGIIYRGWLRKLSGQRNPKVEGKMREANVSEYSLSSLHEYLLCRRRVGPEVWSYRRNSRCHN